MPTTTYNVNVGVLGHVDSGKTSLGEPHTCAVLLPLLVLLPPPPHHLRNRRPFCARRQLRRCPPRCPPPLWTRTLRAVSGASHSTWVSHPSRCVAVCGTHSSISAAQPESGVCPSPSAALNHSVPAGGGSASHAGSWVQPGPVHAGGLPWARLTDPHHHWRRTGGQQRRRSASAAAQQHV